jgi:hypothetical protein
MRSIEEKIDIPDSRKDDFRREIMNYIGALSIDGKTFDYKTNERLYKALELKLFEDQKDSIKLTSLVSNVVDAETQQKIDVVKGRLIRDYGYDDESATDVLNTWRAFLLGGIRRDTSRLNSGQARHETVCVTRRTAMIMKIERDQRRFRQIVRGRIRQIIWKYITHGEMIGRKVAISSAFRCRRSMCRIFGSAITGQGRRPGCGEEGSRCEAERSQRRSGTAGSVRAAVICWKSISRSKEWPRFSVMSWNCRIEPRGQASIVQEKSKYNSIRQTGPESLRHFKRYVSQALARQISTGVMSRRIRGLFRSRRTNSIGRGTVST